MLNTSYIENKTWKVISWSMGIFLIAPTLFLLVSIFLPLGKEGEEIWSHVTQYLVGPALKDTGILVVGTALVALLLGVPPAWVLSQYDFKGSKAISIALVLPLAIPAYIYAFLITDIREALVPMLISVRKHYGVDAYLFLEAFSRYFWLILVFSSVLYPYVFLAARSAFLGNLRSLSEASRALGTSVWKTFWKVQLPLARPALVSSLFLVSMEVLNDYGAVKHFGFSTITVTLFRTWFGLGELAVAQRLAGWVLMLVFLVLIFEKLQRGRRLFEQEKTVREAGGGGKVPLKHALAFFAPLALGLVLPFILLFRWMIMAWETVPPEMWSELSSALWNSLRLGGVAMVLTTVMAVIIVGAASHVRGVFTEGLSRCLQVAGYACPGAVMAIGVLAVLQVFKKLSGEHPISDWFVLGSFFGLVFALCCRYYAVSGQMLSQALERLPKGYQEASKALGKNSLFGFTRISLPLVIPALLGGAALVFVDISKELPLCLLLRPFNFETLGTYTYGLVDQGQLYDCAYPSCFLIMLSMVGVLAVELGRWKKR